MAIAFDNAAYQQNTPVSSQSYSFTVGSGSDRILMIGIETAGGSFGSADRVNSVTYGGVAATRVNTVANANRQYLYQLVAPATGSNTLSITTSSGSGLMRSSPVSYTGVDQTTPIDVNGTNTGSTTSMNISLTSTVDNCWMVVANENSSGQPTAGTGTTLRTNSSGGGFGFLDSNSDVTPAGTYTLQFTQPVATAFGNCAAMLAPAPPPTDVKNSSLATNLISYWELEEASGTRVDSHGVNDLTDNNTVLSATGIQGDGADFERDNAETLSITDAAQTGLDITGDLSLSMWYKFETDVVGQAVFMSKWKSVTGGRSYLFYKEADNFLRFANSSSGVWTGSTKFVAFTPTTGVWYHFALVYDASAGSVAFYVDGVQQGTTQTGLNTSTYNGTADFTLGGSGDGSQVDGAIDEAAIWSRTLSAAEVTSLYNSGAGLPYEAAAAPTTFSLTVNASKVAATLTDYPAYVDLSEMPAAFWAEVTNGGGDIRCYSDSGLTTELAREVVSCDTVTDTGEMHVKVPSLTTSSVIYVTVDGASSDYAVTDTYGRNAVWSDYDTVLHMSEDPSGTAPQIVNSTGGSGFTSGGSMTAGDVVAGQVGDALDFDGSDDILTGGDSTIGNGWTELYMSLWVNNASAPSWFDQLLGKNDCAIDAMQFNGDFSNTNQTNFRHRTTSTTYDVTIASDASVWDGSWHQLTVRWTGSQVRTFFDGTFANLANTSGNMSTRTEPLEIANRGCSAAATQTKIDEVRVAQNQFSDDWITTEYNNQSDVTTFWTIAEAGGGGGATNNATFFGGGM